jgi:chromosome segregation ATPase
MESDYAQVSKQRDSYSNAVNALSANQNKLVEQLGEKNKEIQKKEQKVETLQSEVDSVMSDLQNEKIGREDAERVVQKSQQALMQAISDVDAAFAEADSYKEQMNKNYDMAEKAKKDHEDKMNALRSRFEEAYPDWEDDIQQTSLSNSDVKEMVDEKESKKKDKARQEAIDKMRKDLESAEKDLEQARRRKEARKQRAEFFEDMKRNIFGG